MRTQFSDFNFDERGQATPKVEMKKMDNRRIFLPFCSRTEVNHDIRDHFAD